MYTWSLFGFFFLEINFGFEVRTLKTVTVQGQDVSLRIIALAP